MSKLIELFYDVMSMIFAKYLSLNGVNNCSKTGHENVKEKGK